MTDKTITLDVACNASRITEEQKPRIGILDSRFVYVPAERSDIRKTFERLRQAKVLPVNVKPLRKQGERT